MDTTINIELSYIEELKRLIKIKDDEINELNDKLNSLSEDNFLEESEKKAAVIAISILEVIIKDLGFINQTTLDVYEFRYLRRKLGPNWYKSDKLKSELILKISPIFKQAFIQLTINK